jgi:hypothetical protein
MAPENVAAVVVYLASPLCRFTGRVFGIIGDDLVLYDGWTAGPHFENKEQTWTAERLQRALAELAPQQRIMTQALKGVTEDITPPTGVLDALAALERGEAS